MGANFMLESGNGCGVYILSIDPSKLPYTVDREIFVVKIIRILNFRVKNISPPDGSAM